MVAYFRISSAKSGGESSLGIEAQRVEVQRHVEENGCDLIASYVEVETGKKHTLDNRPQLRKAVAHARRSKAILVVAKLDRLLRSTVICGMLKTSGVKFTACDNPHANEFTIDILAAVAANEVREISKRTKAALAVKKASGIKLGAHRPECAHNLTQKARKLGAAAAGKAHHANMIAAYDDLLAYILELRNERGLSFPAIAAQLNSDGHTTRRELPWNHVQVMRVLKLAQDRQAA